MTLIDESGARAVRYVSGYRKTLEASCRYLRAQAGEPNHTRARQIPKWAGGLALGTKVMEFAQLGPITLFVAELTRSQQKLENRFKARIQWAVVSDEETVCVGGGATSLQQAKVYAYRAYRAANGVD